jgi:hypothetical protein
MATKILTAHDLATGDVLSSEVTNVCDLIVQATVTGTADTTEIKYSFVANEGDGGYTPVRDDNQDEINFRTMGNGDYRLTVKGIESESVKVSVKIPAGSVGALTIESLKTEKTAV